MLFSCAGYPEPPRRSLVVFGGGVILSFFGESGVESRLLWDALDMPWSAVLKDVIFQHHRYRQAFTKSSEILTRFPLWGGRMVGWSGEFRTDAEHAYTAGSVLRNSLKGCICVLGGCRVCQLPTPWHARGHGQRITVWS